MKDSEGVAFLQWGLPQMGLKWTGYRKVRRQVMKRIDRRLKELNLETVSDYRDFLAHHPEEWPHLESLCRISISRFYRDKGVYQCLEQDILPELARGAILGGESELWCWSLGCAAGEEPYTLAILWNMKLASRFSALTLKILASDVDQTVIRRARQACYPASSLKKLPEDWVAKAFELTPEGFCLHKEFRENLTFIAQDIRREVPSHSFHLILCRNVAFTYFDDILQQDAMQKIADRLIHGGALVIGSLETLPSDGTLFAPWVMKHGVYRRV